MRFEQVLVILAATGALAAPSQQSYGGSDSGTTPASYGAGSDSPAPANPDTYVPPTGGDDSPDTTGTYGGDDSGEPTTPGNYGGDDSGEDTPTTPDCYGESCPDDSPDDSPADGEECDDEEDNSPDDYPTSTTDCPEPTDAPEEPCLGYDCEKPNNDDGYETVTSTYTQPAACDEAGDDSYGCPVETITTTIIVPCEDTATPTPEPETPEYPSTPETPVTPEPETPDYPAVPPTDDTPVTPVAPPTDDSTTPEYPPTTPDEVPVPVTTGDSGVPPCADGSYECGAPGNGTELIPDEVYVGSASRLSSSIAAGLTFFVAAALML